LFWADQLQPTGGPHNSLSTSLRGWAEFVTRSLLTKQ